MKAPLTPEEIRLLLEERGLRQKDLCSILSLTPSNVSNLMNGNRKISDSEQKLLRLYFFGEIPFEDIRPTQDLSHVLKFSEKEWEILNIIATRNGMATGEWIAGQIREYLAFRSAQFQAEAKQENVTPLPKKKAHLMAAAGTEDAALECEVIDWDMENGKVNVRIIGKSMEPEFQDEDIVTFRHKDWSRSPFMKKGLIYLVRYNDGYLIKRYKTRQPNPGEENAEYLTNSGTVGVLESLNPEFPDIDITGPFDWEGWYDQDSE